MKQPEFFDIAIIGSGPAGIAMALRLRERGLRIVIIEAGNRKHAPRAEAQTLRATHKSPDAHPDAHLYRRRMLGGASTVWGGRCLPFDEIDFLPSRHRPGWPIKNGDVEAYIAPALTFLEAGEYCYDETAFNHPLPWGRLEDGIDFDSIERFSKPTNVWAKYGRGLIRSGVVVLNNTLAREISIDSVSGFATRIELCAVHSGHCYAINARRVVVAAGGIETARLLLSSRSTMKHGLGNDRDLVGRYYMTHLIGDIGTLHYSPAVSDQKLDYRRTADGIYARSIMKLAERLRADAELPNILWRPNIPPVWDAAHGDPVLSAMHFAKRLVQREYAERLGNQGRSNALQSAATGATARHALNIGANPLALTMFAGKWAHKRMLASRKLPSVFLRAPSRSYPMELNAEQFPDSESRIQLDEATDRHGMQLIRLDWRPGNHTIEGIAASLTILQKQVEKSGIGKYDFDAKAIEQNLAPQGGHHIGTARMGASAQTGVVDHNATLFNCPNVHIAGSAIFPTSGCVNPTLLAVALTLRLADHILQLENRK